MTNPGVLGYPNLAQPNLRPDEFDTTWPQVLPVRLFSYFRQHSIDHGVWSTAQAPQGSWYPVGLGWHDFACDYFALMPQLTLARVRAGDIRVLFYYHEGDNPARIKQRLDHLCGLHDLPASAYVFISANSASKDLGNFLYFPDHEPFFAYVNRRQVAVSGQAPTPRYDFTALSRTHKWWRAACMADLEQHGLLRNSLWSYNSTIDIGDRPEDNPIEIDVIPNLREAMHDFLTRGPYTCDSSDETDHNDHRTVNQDLYDHAHCHIVFETHFDADQSGGTFLTEKTYKCLKYGQPFVIVGPPGSLQALRDRGYRVFDHAIDHSYDLIENNTQRWLALRQSLQDLHPRLGREWLDMCRIDLAWNQAHFYSSHASLLRKLSDQLTTFTS